MNRSRSIRSWIIGGSVIFHACLAVAAVLIPKPDRAETAAIEIADIKKKKEPPKPPPPPPPPPPQDKPKPPPPPPARAQSQAKAEAAPVKAEAMTPIATGEDGFADLGGVALGNFGGGGDGVAIPVAGAAGPAAAAGAAAAPKAVTKKAVQQLAAAGPNVCSEAVVRPKRLVGVQGKYTQQAKQAEIEGLVKVEVTVDETGHVIAARLLNGLGYGLDESALEAARKCVYQPATLCGKAVVATAVVAQRFELE
jgi:protein TonB